MATKCPWIVDVGVENFQKEVVDRSQEVPVVVDFWAPWCAPCRMLGPVLEKLAQEYEGRFILAKVNTDAFPEIAAAFGIQGVPTVLAFFKGQVVSHFVGAMPENELRNWLDQFVPSKREQQAQAAEALEATDLGKAEEEYRRLIKENPNDVSARVALARVLYAQGRIEEAKQELDKLAEENTLNSEGEAIRAKIELRLAKEELGSLDDCQNALANDPNNPELKLRYATLLAAEQRYTEAMDICLELVENRQLVDQARQLLVKIFYILGPNDPTVEEYRRRLTMMLY